MKAKANGKARSIRSHLNYSDMIVCRYYYYSQHFCHLKVFVLILTRICILMNPISIWQTHKCLSLMPFQLKKFVEHCSELIQGNFHRYRFNWAMEIICYDLLTALNANIKFAFNSTKCYRWILHLLTHFCACVSGERVRMLSIAKTW